MREYPEYVPKEERPEKNVENIPEGVLKQALRSLKWEKCPHCGEGQWMNYVQGRNTNHTCVGCGATLKTVG